MLYLQSSSSSIYVDIHNTVKYLGISLPESSAPALFQLFGLFADISLHLYTNLIAT
jgi:hypothetical protein